MKSIERFNISYRKKYERKVTNIDNATYHKLVWKNAVTHIIINDTIILPEEELMLFSATSIDGHVEGYSSPPQLKTILIGKKAKPDNKQIDAMIKKLEKLKTLKPGSKKAYDLLEKIEAMAINLYY